jgi:hypothetical protein
MKLTWQFVREHEMRLETSVLKLTAQSEEEHFLIPSFRQFCGNEILLLLNRCRICLQATVDGELAVADFGAACLVNGETNP